MLNRSKNVCIFPPAQPSKETWSLTLPKSWEKQVSRTQRPQTHAGKNKDKKYEVLKKEKSRHECKKGNKSNRRQQTRHDQNRLHEEKQSRADNGGTFPTTDVLDGQILLDLPQTCGSNDEMMHTNAYRNTFNALCS